MPLTYRSTSCDSFREKLLAGDDIPNQLESTALNESSDQQDVEMDTIKTRRRGQVPQYFRKIWYIVLCSLTIWGAYSLFDRAAPEVQRYISAKHTSLAQSHPPAKLIEFVTGLEALGHDHHHQADNEAHQQLQLAQHDTHKQHMNDAGDQAHDTEHKHEHEHDHLHHHQETSALGPDESGDQIRKVQAKSLAAYRPGIKPKRPRSYEMVERPGISSKRPRSPRSIERPGVYGKKSRSIDYTERPQGRRP